MNAPAWLVQYKAQQALDTFVVNELPWHGYAALAIGYFTLVLLAVIVAVLAWSLVSRSLRGWFVKEPPQDIPEFVICTCVPTMYVTNSAGHTAALREFRRVNPKCPQHGHPAYGTPTSRKPQPLREVGGGKLEQHEERKRGTT